MATLYIIYGMRVSMFAMTAATAVMFCILLISTE